MKNKIDWTIHAVVDTYNNNPLLDGMVNLHTHGLAAHGLTELSAITVPEAYSPKEVMSILNDIGYMMVNGETFDVNPNVTHYIDNPDGSIVCKFKLMPAKCFGEDTIRVILADLDGKFFDGETNLNPPQFALLHTYLFETEEDKWNE